MGVQTRTGAFQTYKQPLLAILFFQWQCILQFNADLRVKQQSHLPWNTLNFIAGWAVKSRRNGMATSLPSYITTSKQPCIDWIIPDKVLQRKCEMARQWGHIRIAEQSLKHEPEPTWSISYLTGKRFYLMASIYIAI